MKAHFFILAAILFSLSILSCSDDDTKPEESLTSISFTGSKTNCSDFFVSILESDTNTKTSLTITGSNKNDLSLNEELKVFQLPNENLTIEISTWDLSVAGFFCNDAVELPAPEKTDSWQAISGTASMSVTNVETSEIEGVDFYNLSVILENVILENAAGNQVTLETLVLTDLSMGFLPG